MTDPVPTRLYLTAPGRIDEPNAFARLLGPVLEGADVACLRYVARDEGEARRLAKALLPVCHAHDVALLITGHVELAASLGLDGVHLDDPRQVRWAREVLGDDASIGAFCDVSRHAGLTAAEMGADYIAFSAAGDEGAALIEWWWQMIEIPCVAEAVDEPAAARALSGKADFIVPAPIWEQDAAAALATYAEALKG